MIKLGAVVRAYDPVVAAERWLDFTRVASTMVEPHAFVDARNLLDSAAMRRFEFSYQGVGR